MTEISTQGQLRMSYLRWALVTVPAIVLIGSLMGLLSNSGYGNRWFAALDLPPVTPPGWVFVTVWPILYICLGLSLAMILHARGAKGRGFALLLFFVQLIANFAWSLDHLAALLDQHLVRLHAADFQHVGDQRQFAHHLAECVEQVMAEFAVHHQQQTDAHAGCSCRRCLRQGGVMCDARARVTATTEIGRAHV